MLADEQVRIVREEAEAARAERERRAAPTVQLAAKPIGTNDVQPPTMIMLTVFLGNEHGTRPADGVTFNLRVPDFFDPRASEDPDGVFLVFTQATRLPEQQLGDHRGVIVWHPFVDTLYPKAERRTYVRLMPVRAGAHRIEAELLHADLPNGRSFQAWTLTVPPTGVDIGLTSVEDQTSDPSDEGSSSVRRERG